MPTREQDRAIVLWLMIWQVYRTLYTSALCCLSDFHFFLGSYLDLFFFPVDDAEMQRQKMVPILMSHWEGAKLCGHKYLTDLPSAPLDSQTPPSPPSVCQLSLWAFLIKNIRELVPSTIADPVLTSVWSWNWGGDRQPQRKVISKWWLFLFVFLFM